MITLKYWNSLSQATRTKICGYFGNPNLDKPYHHNFDYDANGKALKAMLSSCNLQKSGVINVTIGIVPKFSKLSEAKKESKTKTPEMSKWKFRMYRENDSDGEWVWASGYTESEARQEIESDYWGISRLECYGKL